MTATPPSERGDPQCFGDALQFLRSLWKLNHALESASRGMRRQFGVTGPERLFIRVVGHRPGVTPGEVAEILHVDRSTVTPLIKRLERRRLVTRAPSPVDARSFRLKLTRAGEQIDGLRSGTIEAIVAAAIAESSAREVETAAAIMTRVADKLTSSAGRSRARPPVVLTGPPRGRNRRRARR